MPFPVDHDPRTKFLADQLIDLIRPLQRCAVAFSGGVDSAVVARAAFAALGDGALAVTGVSPSLANGELGTACRVAAHIGIRHRVVETGETQLAEYRRNDRRRCFHCKTELYQLISRLQSEEGIGTVLSGTNADDLSDYRPGLATASDFGVRHPLAECHIDKQMVRALARYWNLDVWDKPATPCLASRIAYGVEVTHSRLRSVDAAEQFLKSLGFGPLRVRLHAGEMARIEVPLDQISRFSSKPLRCEIAARLNQLGFRSVSLDPNGFRSGSLNESHPTDGANLDLFTLDIQRTVTLPPGSATDSISRES